MHASMRAYLDILQEHGYFFFLLFYSFLSFFFLHGKTKGIDLGAVVAYSRLDIIDEEYV